MKIAFVGKGGAGKSSTAALFVRWLRGQRRPVLAVDADINTHLARLLGAAFPAERQLHRHGDALRAALHGTGTGWSAEGMLPTATPHRGSHVIRSVDDAVLDGVALEIEPGLRTLEVGSYTEEGIGASCYHTALFSLENLLSHCHLAPPAAMVCDMVAGTDAFAYSLHAQFDAIVLAVEPTPESLGVVQQYRALAQKAGVASLVHLVGNKIADAEDRAWLEAEAGQPLLSAIPLLPALRKARQQGALPQPDMLPDADAVFAPVLAAAQNPALDAQARLALLHKLHRKLAAKDWVKQSYGEAEDRIDTGFRFDDLARPAQVTG